MGEEIDIGPRPEKYLDLRPHDTYDQNVEALDSLAEGDYQVVYGTLEDFHPRVFHRTFSSSYGQEGDAVKVDSEEIEEIQDILGENSGKDYFWPEEKLFNLGYSLGPKERKTARDKRTERKKPYLPHGRDMMPEFDTPMPKTPVRNGRKKRGTDGYYERTALAIAFDIGEKKIEVV